MRQSDRFVYPTPIEPLYAPRFWTFDPVVPYGDGRTVPESCRRLGDNIRYLRTVRRWSQEALGLETGLNRTLVGAIERAEINTTLGTAEKFAQAFGLSLSELLAFQAPCHRASGVPSPSRGP